jgi:hypothetical protein
MAFTRLNGAIPHLVFKSCNALQKGQNSC